MRDVRERILSQPRLQRRKTLVVRLPNTRRSLHRPPRSRHSPRDQLSLAF